MVRRACVQAMRSVRSQSDEIERVPLQVYQRYILQRILMGGTEDQARCDTGIERLLPVRGAQAPAISRLQARAPEFGSRRAQIVTSCLLNARNSFATSAQTT
jgi:hypothetical protein